MATIRHRGGEKNIIKNVKNFDAFRKVPEEYIQTSQIGGTLSILSRILIIYLIQKEVSYYNDSNLIFKFKPDIDLDKKLDIHVDITVAMPCRSIGADIVDSTNENMRAFGTLTEEDTWWELCPLQRAHFEGIQHLNTFLREEYHSIVELLFKDILYNDGADSLNKMPKRSIKPIKPYDSCRIHGTLTLNKVAGNMHILAGKSLHLPQGHIHINSIFDDVVYNFTHRINKLSFGDIASRIIQPLEGDERYIKEASTMVQYFIEVVPTEIHGFMSSINTYQYSVKENIRPIDHDKGSHGTPGLYFKYDMSALKVVVKQDRDNVVQFLIRLCSIIAGIVVISGIINTFLRELHRMCVRKVKPTTATGHIQPQTIPVHDLQQIEQSTTGLNQWIKKMYALIQHLKKLLPWKSKSVQEESNLPEQHVQTRPQKITISNNLILNANSMSESDDTLTIKNHLYL